ncbi:hypothetical protein SAMN05660337_2021 [Maridesulfovibrio ferrireducens]|uniref:Uncharacterized protein n=1 Tax=Maridesulfovibrio ferrireducens TaxID=246191 RepID=A0A1G9H5X6_9BACT|nr:hypothetical protein [Maridesulfovibrio ferrireducens]SDL08331.1 hypothetical protein SAMN05660337_2021 [Maridesulfovibrio ferrireducens]
MSEGYMEKALLKLAKQLNAYDEASLTGLWNKYEAIVAEFEPTRKWEEAAVVFGMIQAIRLKNQLFNYHWAESCGPESMSPRPDFIPMKQEEDKGLKSESGPDSGGGDSKRRKVLSFEPRKDS